MGVVVGVEEVECGEAEEGGGVEAEQVEVALGGEGEASAEVEGGDEVVGVVGDELVEGELVLEGALCVDEVGDVIELSDEGGGLAEVVEVEDDGELGPDGVAIGMEAALGHGEGVALSEEELLDEVGDDGGVLGVGARGDGGRFGEEGLRVDAEEGAEGGVDVDPAQVEVCDTDADGAVLEDVLEGAERGWEGHRLGWMVCKKKKVACLLLQAMERMVQGRLQVNEKEAIEGGKRVDFVAGSC